MSDVNDYDLNHLCDRLHTILQEHDIVLSTDEQQDKVVLDIIEAFMESNLAREKAKHTYVMW